MNDTRSVAVSLNALAVFSRELGDLRDARSLFEQSLTLCGQLHDSLAVARALSNLANVVASQGDSGAACAFYQQSLATFREPGDPWGIAGSLADLGNLSREQSDFREADALYRESLNLFHSLEQKRRTARLLESFACSAAAQSQFERALRLAGPAAALRQSIRAPLTPVEETKLEKGLAIARAELATADGRNAWLSGWVMSVKKAIEDALAPPSDRESTRLA